ncbi:hypothetical protein ACOSQ4_014845 [Xanthoceras sorbifolium]
MEEEAVKASEALLSSKWVKAAEVNDGSTIRKSGRSLLLIASNRNLWAFGNARNLNTVGSGDSKGATGHREARRTSASEAGDKVMDCSKLGAKDRTAIEANVTKLKMRNWENQNKEVKNNSGGKQVGSRFTVLAGVEEVGEELHTY